MDDCFAVRRVQPVGDLAGVIERLIERKGAAKHLAFDQFQDEVARVVGFEQIVNRREVRVIERRQSARLSPQTRHALGIVGERAHQHLDGDIAAELRIVSAVHLPHPARPEAMEDLV